MGIGNAENEENVPYGTWSNWSYSPLSVGKEKHLQFKKIPFHHIVIVNKLAYVYLFQRFI